MRLISNKKSKCAEKEKRKKETRYALPLPLYCSTPFVPYKGKRAVLMFFFFIFNFALRHRIEQGLIARYAYRETGGEIPHVSQVPERCWFYSSFFFFLFFFSHLFVMMSSLRSRRGDCWLPEYVPRNTGKVKAR